MRLRDLTEMAPADYDLQAKYEHFNQTLFGGKLPQIPVEFKPLKNVGGVFWVKVHRAAGTPIPHPILVRLGKVDKRQGASIIPGSFRMQLSSVYKRDEQALDGILVHEMVHVEMMSTGWFSEHHGRRFMARLHELQKQVPFRIPLTDDVSGLELAEPVKSRKLGLILLRLRDGSFQGCLVNLNLFMQSVDFLIDRMQRMLNYHSQISEIDLYTVQSPVWDALAMQLPIKRAVKGIGFYKIKDPNAVPDLERKGTLIHKLTKPDSPKSSMNEMIRIDREHRMMIGVNPTQAEFRAKFPEGAGGIITENGTLIIGEGIGFTAEHYSIWEYSGVNSPEKYRLQIFPKKVLVELWDDFDRSPKFGSFQGKLTPAVIERFTLYPRRVRDQIGAEIKANRFLARMYGGVPPIIVGVLSSAISYKPSGWLASSRY